ncbi:MAG: hypothetical protein ACYC9L_05665 [Sulfuricaulis sp.]
MSPETDRRELLKAAPGHPTWSTENPEQRELSDGANRVNTGRLSGRHSAANAGIVAANWSFYDRAAVDRAGRARPRHVQGRATLMRDIGGKVVLLRGPDQERAREMKLTELRKDNAKLNVRLAIYREVILTLCDKVEKDLPPFEGSEVVYTRELLDQYRTMCQ